MSLAMYILVNKNIEMSPGKLAGQVAHAAVRYATEKDHEGRVQAWLLSPSQTKIVVYAPQPLMESLEQRGSLAIRDMGKTELEPNTLTTICAGIYNNGAEHDNRPPWLKRLRLV